MYSRSTLFCLCVLFALQIGYAQEKHYNVKIRFPQSVDLGRLSVTIYDGIKGEEISPEFSNNAAMISGKYYSAYFVIRFAYPLAKNLRSVKTFFIEKEESGIFFTDSTSQDILKSFSADNVIEDSVFKGADQYAKFVYEEQKLSDDYLHKHRDDLDEDSIMDGFNLLCMKLLKKEMTYIKNNDQLYYSFWLFKDDLIGNPDTFTPDTLLAFFNSSFPETLKKSVEGQEVRKLLEGRAIKRYALAPDFTSKTYDGKQVKLSDMKGRFVVLDFWASWCGPCLELMPEIKKIRDKFPAEQVEIISVSRDEDTTAFMKNIKKYGMTWLNILADPNVYKSYGGRFLPDVYIIDREGKIIYRGQTDDPVDYVTFLEAEMKKPIGSAKL